MKGVPEIITIAQFHLHGFNVTVIHDLVEKRHYNDGLSSGWAFTLAYIVSAQIFHQNIDELPFGKGLITALQFMTS